jgi:hypothetical protein
VLLVKVDRPQDRPALHSFHRYGHRSVLPGRRISIRGIASTVPQGPEMRTPPEGGVPA